MHLHEAWELFKQEARSIANEIGSVRSCIRNAGENQLLKSLYNLYDLDCETPGLYSEDVADVKCQLSQFDAESYRAVRIRSRANCALHSEQPTRQALLDEHRRAVANRILALYCGSALATSTDLIMSEFERYYASPFSASREATDAD